MSSLATVILLASASIATATLIGFLIYIVIRYAPIVGRIFEEKPMFLPLRVKRVEGNEDVRFRTPTGVELVGTYFKARTEARLGVLVFCHEYLSDRWSAIPYVDHLRDQGFDLFSFDFRNHGESPKDADYVPLQWVTDHELDDLRGALAYLRSRPDADKAGFGLFGVSRGGGTALCVAARDPGVWGVITDGAFPTRGTMLAYITRWAGIYVGNPFFWKLMPTWVFEFLGWSARFRTQRKLHCRYANVERAAAKLAPRPWLMIHGAKDAYIGADIARGLFDRAREPKEFWLVPGAKHNRCREKEPILYPERISTFLRRYSPRTARPASPVPVSSTLTEPGDFAPITVSPDFGVAVAG
ncbi:alpha/beta hydrolase [Tundrisphaera sp. TA3]|uniref:alpha/beta hydrolase n=1 Tax=Tundrisphaera sp. TA3 TaxID=3435775 RepID=UPI003EB6B070